MVRLASGHSSHQQRARDRDLDLVLRGLSRLKVKFGNFKGVVRPDRMIGYMKINHSEVGLVSLCHAYNSKKIIQAAIRELIRRKDWLSLESALHWDSNVTDERTKKIYQKRDLYALRMLKSRIDEGKLVEYFRIITLIRRIYEDSKDESGIVQTKAMRTLLYISREENWLSRSHSDAIRELKDILAAPMLKCKMFDELIDFIGEYINGTGN